MIRSLTISEDDIGRYEGDGAVCPWGLIDQAWLNRLCKAINRLLAAAMAELSTKGDAGTFVGDLDVGRKDPDFRASALKGPSARIAQTLMRSFAVRLPADQLFVEEPGSTSSTPWHHDQACWPVVGDPVRSVWIAMDHTSPESSELVHARCSHRWGRRFDPEDFGECSLDMLRDPGSEIIDAIGGRCAKYEFLSRDTAPGDCPVHQALTVHGAGNNRFDAEAPRDLHSVVGRLGLFPSAGFVPAGNRGTEAGAPMTSALFPCVTAAR